MTGQAYDVDDIAAMAAQLERLPAPTGDEPTLVALGAAIRDYLRVAPGRASASEAKIALGAAILDLWAHLDLAADADPGSTGSSPSATTPGILLDADTLSIITIAAATAAVDAGDDEAGVAVRHARARIDEASRVAPHLAEVRDAADALGRHTAFRLDLEAGRAERIWRAMFAFATEQTPLVPTDVPDDARTLVTTVDDRVDATDAATRSELGAAWPAPVSGGTIGVRELPSGPTVAAPEPRTVREQPTRGVPVWFATNRTPTTRGDETSGYRNALDGGGLHYGRCFVTVPAVDEVTGGLLDFVSAWFRIGSTRAARFRVESFYRFEDGGSFRDELGAELGRMSEDARSMLVYIHGFGATMRSAAESAARLSVAIKHPGATAMFSWASRANVLRYWDDQRTVDASGAALDEFLQTLATVNGVDHIDLVVHSLGNRLFLRTLVERLRSGAVLPWPLRNLFLGAPDVDQSEFLNDASAYGQALGTTTLYGSNSDTALLISSLLHQTARAGLMPPPVLTDGVDTIETSGIDTSWLRHSGILESPVIHADIAQIRSGITDPDDRTGLHRVDATPVPYWRY